MIQLTNVSKSYGKKQVLDQIDLHFDNPAGVYGVLGRNGVGKTTLMKMIFNMIPNYQGEITVNGKSVKNNNDLLQDIVYVGGDINKQNYLLQGKIKDVLKQYHNLYENFDMDFAKMMLESYGIKLKDKFAKLSTGNKTLVQNTIGVATRAPITILDEPTNGLDSVNRQSFFRFMMNDYAEYPRLFLLSTHLIQEVENYLTDVVILKDAKVLVADSLENIQAKSFKVINFPLPDKNVLEESTLGSQKELIVYDQFSPAEVDQIKANGGEVHPINLQTLFNALVQK